MNELPRSSPEFFLCPQICCNSTTQSKLANPNSEQIFFSGSESQIPVKVLVRNEDERIPFFFFFWSTVQRSMDLLKPKRKQRFRSAILTPTFALSTSYFYKRKMLTLLPNLFS